ncbi:RNA polymerase sigma factor [Marinicella sp. W31]|uniref:RNA polymerase sigma factor n=1 Tax=Marinicella sp. W31 TaxID=3023713 RepID=UPI003756AE3D
MQEELLIKQAQNGATSSFSQLVALYQPRLCQYLLSRCYREEDVDDIIQETFISAYHYIKSYNPRWAFSTWLFTIARRLLGKHNRAYFDAQNVHLDDHEEMFVVDDYEIDRNNIWLHVKKSVSVEAYDVLWFYYAEELSLKEIAYIMKRTLSWVKIMLYRSKNKLAKQASIQELSKGFLRDEAYETH